MSKQEDLIAEEPAIEDTAAPEAEVVEQEEAPEAAKKTTVTEDGTFVVNLSDDPVEEAVEAETSENEEQQEDTPTLELVVDSEEEISKVEVDAAEEVEKPVEQPATEALPEGVQKLVDFMAETGGSLEDYVMLNRDVSQLDDKALLHEFYSRTKSHLNKEEINFLIEDNFDYDEDLDSDRDIRRKKLAFKEEVNAASRHVTEMREKYYSDIKADPRLTEDQAKAVDFFNRHNKEADEISTERERLNGIFNKQTDKVFGEDFKGFEFQVGEQKYRFNVKNVDSVKETQGDIKNVFKKFLGKTGEMTDAKGYHKALFAATNPDVVANHFYEQGKADAIKHSTAASKNINMDPRGGHNKVDNAGAFKARVVSGDDTSKLRIKLSK